MNRRQIIQALLDRIDLRIQAERDGFADVVQSKYILIYFEKFFSIFVAYRGCCL